MRLRSVLACVAVTPLIIGAAEPVRLQPSSPWDVDYGDNSCRLMRIFGEGKTKTLLILESGAPGEMDMLVIGKPLTSSSERVAARFLPVKGAVMQGEMAKATDNGDPAILWASVPLLPQQVLDQLEKEGRQRKAPSRQRPPPLDLAKEARLKRERWNFADQVTELEIGTRRNHPVVLETGSLGKPMAMFNQCGRDSLKDWGADPALEDKIVRPVWALNSNDWFSSGDYPPDMVARGEQSQVTVRVLVDATGRVTKCTSLSHFSQTEFNKITCAVVTQRARFAPAELADGTKVPSYYVRRVIFRMP